MEQTYVTGQLLLYPKGEKDGRTLFMVVGIVAAPPGAEWQEGYQYTVVGSKDCWRLDLEPPRNRHEETRRLDANGMLTTPIWQV